MLSIMDRDRFSEQFEYGCGRPIFNLSQAFECVDYKKQLEKPNLQGVQGIEHQVKSSDGSQIVNMSNKFADSCKLSYGVLQEFLIHIFMIFAVMVKLSMLQFIFGFLNGCYKPI